MLHLVPNIRDTNSPKNYLPEAFWAPAQARDGSGIPALGVRAQIEPPGFRRSTSVPSFHPPNLTSSPTAPVLAATPWGIHTAS